MRKGQKFALLFAGDSQELEGDERELHNESEGTFLPQMWDGQESPADFGDLSKFGIWPKVFSF